MYQQNMRHSGIFFMCLGVVLLAASVFYAIVMGLIVFTTHWFSAATLAGLTEITGPQVALLIAGAIIGLLGAAIAELSKW